MLNPRVRPRSMGVVTSEPERKRPDLPEEFEKFRTLVNKLVAVPKREIDAKDKARKKRRRSA